MVKDVKLCNFTDYKTLIAMNSRNPYLISKALKTFMWGSILASVSSQVATTTDAIVVSNLIGPDAISSINLVMPVLTVFNCIMILFGIGGTVVAAKALGRRDDATSNGVFSSSVLISAAVGILLAVFTYFLSPYIIGSLAGNHTEIYNYAISYLHTMCVVFPFLILAGLIENFVKTDGNPKLVMLAVMVGGVLNLILDIVFIKYLNLGIAGSAWATGINFVVAIAICTLHFRNPHASLKWRLNLKLLGKYVRESVVQGIPMSINTLLLGAFIYCINSIVLRIQGADGIYCWSVCMQLFMIMQMVLAGIGSSIYAIGGLLVGEQDMRGLDILNRRCITYACGALLAVMLFIITFPEGFGQLFGNGSGKSVAFLPTALRIFSLFLVPYAFVALIRSTYQILGQTALSLFLSIFQFVIMAGFVWGCSFISPIMLWWGFPVSAFSLVIMLIIYTAIVHHRKPELNFITLIPKHENVKALNISVKMDAQDVQEAEKEIERFLKEANINDFTAYQVRLCCEELMNNIVNYAVAKHPEKHFFDLHIRSNKDSINVLLKDDGRPFNPLLSEDDTQITLSETEEKLGLKIVNRSLGTLSYKYMYDQNMVQLVFARND